MSPAKHPHTITPPPCVTVGTIHAEIISSPTPCHGGWNQKSQIWTRDQRTDFHWSNVHYSCFLAQASLFLLFVSFSSDFFVAIRPRRPDSRSLNWTVDAEMCLLLELCEAFIWAAISEAGNSNELILCSRGNFLSSFPLAVLMRT